MRFSTPPLAFLAKIGRFCCLSYLPSRYFTPQLGHSPASPHSILITIAQERERDHKLLLSLSLSFIHFAAWRLFLGRGLFFVPVSFSTLLSSPFSFPLFTSAACLLSSSILCSSGLNMVRARRACAVRHADFLTCKLVALCSGGRRRWRQRRLGACIGTARVAARARTRCLAPRLPRLPAAATRAAHAPRATLRALEQGRHATRGGRLLPTSSWRISSMHLPFAHTPLFSTARLRYFTFTFHF